MEWHLTCSWKCLKQSDAFPRSRCLLRIRIMAMRALSTGAGCRRMSSETSVLTLSKPRIETCAELGSPSRGCLGVTTC